MTLTTLRSCNYVHPPTTARALATIAGIQGEVSIRDLITLLGPAAFGPRAFDIVGHNPHTKQKVLSALRDGANTIELDVNVYSARPHVLCVSHGEGDANAPSLEAYLRDLHDIASSRDSKLALVVFDCKHTLVKASVPDSATVLLEFIRKYLTYDLALNIIISIGSLWKASFFDTIRTRLGPREGLMIDEENDFFAVSSYFSGLHVPRQC
jgi:hypothetical protein